jgi:3-hydroxyisobutyrate dehydrogenase
MRYGFIGLGHLGRHLAASLARGGFALTVHDRRHDAAAPLLEPGRVGRARRARRLRRPTP